MTPPRIALATAVAAFGHDVDQAPLQAAFAAAGADCEVLAWDDPTVSWSRFDAVLLRSTWDYAERRAPFLEWCTHVHSASRLFNPPDVVAWNTDKHYLSALGAAGVAVVPSTFLHPGEDPTLPPDAEFVVKPAVGAGARDARRFTDAQRDQALGHAGRLLAAGRSVLVQPYLAQVDQHGETSLIFIDGGFSHAIRKGPLLAPGAAATAALFAPEAIVARDPSSQELELARKALAAQPFGALLYARVDLLPTPDGPLLLELELTEPSLFFAHGADAATRLAAALLARLAA